MDQKVRNNHNLNFKFNLQAPAMAELGPAQPVVTTLVQRMYNPRQMVDRYNLNQNKKQNEGVIKSTCMYSNST